MGVERRRTFFHFGAFRSHFRYFKIRAPVFVYPAGETFLMPKGGLGLVWKRSNNAAKMWRARSRETLAATSEGLLVWATHRHLKQKFLLLHQIKCLKKNFLSLSSKWAKYLATRLPEKLLPALVHLRAACIFEKIRLTRRL